MTKGWKGYIKYSHIDFCRIGSDFSTDAVPTRANKIFIAIAYRSHKRTDVFKSWLAGFDVSAVGASFSPAHYPRFLRFFFSFLFYL